MLVLLHICHLFKVKDYSISSLAQDPGVSDKRVDLGLHAVQRFFKNFFYRADVGPQIGRFGVLLSKLRFRKVLIWKL